MNLQSVELISVLCAYLKLVIVLARMAAAALFWLASEALWASGQSTQALPSPMKLPPAWDLSAALPPW